MVVIVRVLVPLSFPPIAHKMWHPAQMIPAILTDLAIVIHILSITTHFLQGCIGLHRHKKTAQPPRTNLNREKVIEKQTNETAANTPTHAKQPSASYLNVLLFFLEHRSFLVVNDTCIQQLLCYCKSKSNYEQISFKVPFLGGRYYAVGGRRQRGPNLKAIGTFPPYCLLPDAIQTLLARFLANIYVVGGRAHMPAKTDHQER